MIRFGGGFQSSLVDYAWRLGPLEVPACLTLGGLAHTLVGPVLSQETVVLRDSHNTMVVV